MKVSVEQTSRIGNREITQRTSFETKDHEGMDVAIFVQDITFALLSVFNRKKDAGRAWNAELEENHE